jgi:hypothetical protein
VSVVLLIIVMLGGSIFIGVLSAIILSAFILGVVILSDVCVIFYAAMSVIMPKVMAPKYGK